MFAQFSIVKMEPVGVMKLVGIQSKDLSYMMVSFVASCCCRA